MRNYNEINGPYDLLKLFYWFESFYIYFEFCILWRELIAQALVLSFENRSLHLPIFFSSSVRKLNVPQFIELMHIFSFSSSCISYHKIWYVVSETRRDETRKKKQEEEMWSGRWSMRTICAFMAFLHTYFDYCKTWAESWFELR